MGYLIAKLIYICAAIGIILSAIAMAGGVALSILNTWDGYTWIQVPILSRIGFIMLSTISGFIAIAFFLFIGKEMEDVMNTVSNKGQ